MPGTVKEAAAKENTGARIMPHGYPVRESRNPSSGIAIKNRTPFPGLPVSYIVRAVMARIACGKYCRSYKPCNRGIGHIRVFADVGTKEGHKIILAGLTDTMADRIIRGTTGTDDFTTVCSEDLNTAFA